MLTKTQLKVMQVFASQITEMFSIRGIALALKMNYSLVHRAVKPLVGAFLQSNKQNYLLLDYKENHDVLAFVEYSRRNEFLELPRNSSLAIVLQDFVEKFREENFVLLIFGSAVNTAHPRDIDILLIVDNIEKTESSERQLLVVGQRYGLEKKLHVVAVSYGSVYEMLGLRDQLNVMNEVLNKHIIIYGAELFYRLLARGRK